MNTLKKKILDMARAGRIAEAVSHAETVAQESPLDAEVLGALSHAHEIAGNIEAALQWAGKAVSLSPDEPALRFHRGKLLLLVDDPEGALADMESALAHERKLGAAYYAETVAFLRAECLRRLRRHAEALAACRDVRDDFQMHAGTLLTKRDLVKSCARAVNHAEVLAAA